MLRQPPSFDLVVATVDRVAELGRFLDSTEAQQYPQARVIVVDQNEDDRIEAVLEGRSLEVLRVRSERGLSRGRNAALEHLRGDIVAFPDDDCVYPPGLLARVADELWPGAELDGLTGRAEDAEGGSSSSWKRDRAILTQTNLWNRGISFTIFLRRRVIERIGGFDERLGLGSGEAWSSGEETDYLVRAVKSGARVLYDPSLVVRHEVRVDDERIGYRDGASVGYILRKHRYPARVLARMLVRPIGGIAGSLLHGDRRRAVYYAASLRGRVAGYRGASRSKISR